MAIDFTLKMTPEQRERHENRRQRIAERRAELQALEDKDLADRLEYCVVNSSHALDHKHKDLVTYDDALFLAYIPELLRRLRGKEESNSYSELAYRIRKAAGEIG